MQVLSRVYILWEVTLTRQIKLLSIPTTNLIFFVVVSRTWVRNLRPSNTSGQHLMKPLVEKERLDCRLQRASSVNGWNCSSISTSSPSRYPRNAVPQIFAYEPKPGVFRNLNYPAFQSIRIEQVRTWNNQIIITRNTSYWYYILKTSNSSYFFVK